ncbi:bifunctional phosphopantothenoylcysteine decarboxylase/phosphopantothenate--cysteine ligase CoaBC [Agrococcus versicolor]|uniref:Coenzyme A biosynthesis bifunctional protein CoaBC n=1 Tax=Agrococcus versicolor TaxID=501482 RepID=A0ABN3AQC6_9MICO
MRVVVGVAGGIAAYKAAHAIRRLVRDGHDVHVVPTASAVRFVGIPTFEALSRNPVTTDLFDDVAEVRHVALGQSADLIVVLPATASTLARIAHGLSDDLLGTTILASEAPLVVAPAMHTEMWRNAATQANVATLRERGVTIVGPADGLLTGADSGPGRMVEPDDVVEAAYAIVAPTRDLEGMRVVVSAGGTREPIDPVRFLGNRSSGAHGVALAARAAARGADVTLVGANLQVEAPRGVRLVPVSTTAELRDAMLLASRDAHATIMAAAVADYRVAEVSDAKLKKDAWGSSPTLRLTENPDVLVELAARMPRGVVVGFAAETEPDADARRAIAVAKLARKGCDLLVLNQVGVDLGFGDVETVVEILDASGVVATASGPKTSVADAILDVVRSTLQEHA